MYKKYITKKGKKVGPYYYDSIRLRNGKVKSVYLGKDLKKARKKLSLLKKEQSRAVHKRSSATLKKTLQSKRRLFGSGFDNSTLRHRDIGFKDRVFLTIVLLIMLLSFFHFGGLIEEDAGIVVGNVVETNELSNLVGSNRITGSVIFSSETQPIHYDHLVGILSNESSEYDIDIGGIEKLISMSVSGRCVLEEEGVVKIFLADTQSGDTYLLFDSVSSGEDTLEFLKGVSGLVVDALNTIDEGFEQEAENFEIEEAIKYDELYEKGMISGFNVIDSLGDKVRHNVLLEEGNQLRLRLPFSEVYEVNLEGNAEGWMGYQEYTTRGALEPDNISFTKVFGFDLSYRNITNLTNATFTARSGAEYLYGCNFWEFELGICLSNWIYLVDINVTENYTANISWNVMAFAEAIFDPNKSIVEIVEIEEELIDLNEPIEEEIDLFVDLVELSEFVNYTIESFENECGDACFISEFLGDNFELKVYLKDAILEINKIETLVKESNVTEYNFGIFDSLGNDVSVELDVIVNLSIGVVLNETKAEYTEETMQYGAVVGQPVKWKKRILLNKSSRNIKIDIPVQAENISVRKLVDGEVEEINSAKLLTEEGFYERLTSEPVVVESDSMVDKLFGNLANEGNLLTGMAIGEIIESEELEDVEIVAVEEVLVEEVKIVEEIEPKENESSEVAVNISLEGIDPVQIETIEEEIYDFEGHLIETKTVLVEDEVEEIEIEYTTPGPVAVVNDFSDGKRVFVMSETHYENILSNIEIPETKLENVRLYRVVEENGVETRVPHEFEVYDSNDDGLADMVEWVIPSLSNDTYEIELTILNLQSYPVVGGSWKVLFDISGTADLRVNAVEDTFWQENYQHGDDINFISLYCGSQLIVGEWVESTNTLLFPNYNCDTINSFEVGVFTEGKHVLEFDFGGIVKKAYNLATQPWSVQRGQEKYGTVQKETVTLGTPVDITKSFILFDYTSTSSFGNAGDFTLHGNITDGTVVEFRKMTGVVATTPGQELGNVSWQVIQGPITVQHIFSNWTDGTAEEVFNIDHINSSKSIITVYGAGFGAKSKVAGHKLRGYFVNDSRIVIARSFDSSAVNFTVQVIEFPPSYEVTSGSATITSDTLSVSLDENIVVNRTWLYFTHDASVNGLSQTSVVGYIENEGEIVFERQIGRSDAGENNISYFLVEFPNGIPLEHGIVDFVANAANGDDSYGTVVNMSSAFFYTTATSSGTGQAFPRPYWVTYSSTNGTINFYRGYAGTRGKISWQVIEILAPPEISLSYPADATNNLGGSLTFACNATDAQGIENVTLYLDGPEDSNFVGNNSIDGGGNTTVNATIVVNDPGSGNYSWNCLVTDVESNSLIAVTNNSVTIDTPPSVTLKTPANNSAFNRTIKRVTLVVNVTDDGILRDNITLRIFGNFSGVPSRDDLLFKANLTNGTNTSYIWSKHPFDIYPETMFGYHFDLRDGYNENSSLVYDWADRFNGKVLGPSYNFSNDIFGAHLDFDGINDYINVNNTIIWREVVQSQDNMTTMMWLRPRSIADGNGMMVLAGGGHLGGNFYGWALGMLNDDLVAFHGNGQSISSALFFLSNNFFESTTEWVHLAVVRHKNGSYFVYRNGELNASVVHTGAMYTAFLLNTTIGNEHLLDGSFYFNGSIDDITVINRSLSAAEIADYTNLTDATHYWYANGTDSIFSNTTETWEFVMSNGAPVVHNITIGPLAVNTTQPLNCSFTVSDDEDKEIVIHINFLNQSNVSYTTSDDYTIGRDRIISTTLSPFVHRHFQNWTCNVTAVDDSSGVSAVNTSNSIEINNTAPLFGIPIHPLNGTKLINRTFRFVWAPNDTFRELPSSNIDRDGCDGFFCDGNTSDVDNDNVTFIINITCVKVGGGYCEDHRQIEVLENQTNCDANSNTVYDTDDNCSYLFSNDLQYLNDHDYYYEYFIDAKDSIGGTQLSLSSGSGWWAGLMQVMRIDIYGRIELTLDYHTVEFGDMHANEENETWDCVLGNEGPGACPIWINNTGNVQVTINLTGPESGLWDSVDMTDKDYFSLKIGNGSQVVGYVEDESNLSYIAMPNPGTNITIVKNLSRGNRKQAVRLDFNVTVPSAESPGNKSVNINLTAYSIPADVLVADPESPAP